MNIKTLIIAIISALFLLTGCITQYDANINSYKSSKVHEGFYEKVNKNTQTKIIRHKNTFEEPKKVVSAILIQDIKTNRINLALNIEWYGKEDINWNKIHITSPGNQITLDNIKTNKKIITKDGLIEGEKNESGVVIVRDVHKFAKIFNDENTVYIRYVGEYEESIPLNMIEVQTIKKTLKYLKELKNKKN